MKTGRTNRDADPLVLHVHATAGRGGGADGSAGHPYHSLEAARDALRKHRRRHGLKAPVRVNVLPGLYRLDRPLEFAPEDGGTAAFPVTWSGRGGVPVISGGRPVTGWREGVINGRPCWAASLPDVKRGRWWFTQLFVDGCRRWRARWPRRGFLRFAGVPGIEARRDPGGPFHGAMSARFAPGDIKAFRNPADIDVVVPDHWYENHLRLERIDEKKRVMHFSTAGWSRFSRDETGRHARYRLDHVAEACLEPGDWYLDRTDGTLYYLPHPGETMNETLMEAPILDHLLSVRGDALDSARRVRHLRFEHFDFRHADWELPRENPGALQAAINVPAAIRLVGAEDCALYDCRVSQVAGWAIEALRGCHRTRIVGCALHDLGGGGVKIGSERGLPPAWVEEPRNAFRGMDAPALGWGPARKPGDTDTKEETPAAATVSDCSIRDGGLIFHSAAGIWVGDAGGNRILHNRVGRFNYTGISCGWSWGYQPARAFDNRIEGNHIHDIGRGMLSDMGAIYTLGRQAGATIRRNFIHRVRSHGYGGWGIYPDEGSGWIRVEENVVLDTKSGGFHQHYGRDNVVARNLFVDAAECQVRFTRFEMARPATFSGNWVRGAGRGVLLSGTGCRRVRFDRNVYTAGAEAAPSFSGYAWDDWRKLGQDSHSRLTAEGVGVFDAGGGLAATGHPEILKSIGMTPARLAAIVAEAGPRWRGAMPAGIDDIAPEPESARPIVESCFWPWPSEWPDADDASRPWGKLPAAAAFDAGREHPVSMTVRNRGRARVSGRYRFRVVPAKAARWIGPSVFEVDLGPGERAAFDARLKPAGTGGFRVEASSDHEALFDSALFFEHA